jgi:hypothetical protein
MKGTITTSDEKKAEDLAKKGLDVKLTDGMDEGGKDLDGDGDVDGDDYKAARDLAIKRAKKKADKRTKKAEVHMKEEEVEEGKAGKALAGVAIVAALLGINKSASEKIYNSSPKIKSLTSQYEKAKKDGDKEKMAKYKEDIKKEKIKIDKGLDERKATLKEAAKKCKSKGLTKEQTTTVLKRLNERLDMDQLQTDIDSLDDEGNIDLILKVGNLRDTPRNREIIKSKLDQGWNRMDIIGNYSKPVDEEIDTQLALPEPDAPDFLGDDGMDYEGSMAKSQMLKMRDYANKLCDMVEDESQLEAWVQAKITKASDYMSSVYHYLQYEQSQDEEPTQGTY